MTTRLLPGLALAALLGCSPTPSPVSESPPTPADQVGALVRTCRELGRPIPRNPREAEKIPGASPEAIRALKSGEIELSWGVGLAEIGATTLVGHEKDAPAKGGRVILADGTVAELNAEQIRELPRPPAPTAGRGGKPR